MPSFTLYCRGRTSVLPSHRQPAAFHSTHLPLRLVRLAKAQSPPRTEILGHYTTRRDRVSSDPPSLTMSDRFRHDYRHYEHNIDSRPVNDSSAPSHGLSSSICDLDNNIHPIFRPTNFPGANYAALRPALQLASLLIDTDCLLDFWYAIFFGEKKKRYDDGTQREVLAYYRRPGGLSHKDRAATRLKLRALGNMFKFYPNSKERAVGGCQYADGFLLSAPEDLGIFRYPVDHIWYQSERYEHICEFYRAASCSNVSAEEISHMQRTYLRFAATLVHELAHAAVYAELSDETATVFEDSEFTEDGFAWENFSFGGVIVTYMERKEMTHLQPWPSMAYVRNYWRDYGYILGRDTGVNIEPRFLLPKSYVAQFFKAEFWEGDIIRSGSSALRAPLTKAWRALVDVEGQVTFCFELAIGREDEFDGIPHGWYYDGVLFIQPIEHDTGVDPDGFGRLMKIHVDIVQPEHGFMTQGGEYQPGSAIEEKQVRDWVWKGYKGCS